MGLYNMLFAYNPLGSHLLALLNMTREEIPRFRDVYIGEWQGEKAIAVYTRMGGGNRGHWELYDDTFDGTNCSCAGCRAEHYLAAHPAYLGDQDDDFDQTYATYYFRLPKNVDQSQLDLDATPGDKWEAFFKEIK